MQKQVVLGLFGHCVRTMAEEFVDSSGFVGYFGFQVLALMC